MKVAHARTREIRKLEQGEIGEVNFELEHKRLDVRALEKKGEGKSPKVAALQEEIAALQKRYAALRERADALIAENGKDTVTLADADGEEKTIPVAAVVRFFRPNRLGFFGRLGVYLSRLWEFVSGQPRESNTEGGVFPAIFGTVMMVILMSAAVMPFGVIAALYLREYARQGPLVRAVRIAVNNLAGVPSIVFGVFGLGFFVYLTGGAIDKLFFSANLPDPTFKTGGILWASLTLALLTVPVVIVATEESLAAVPRGRARGLLRSRRDEVADDPPRRPPGRAARHPDGADPRHGARRRGGRAAHDHGCRQARAGAAVRRELPLLPPRAQVHAPGLPHLRRRLPVAQRRGGEADGLHDDAPAARRRRVPEPGGDPHPGAAAPQAPLRDVLMEKDDMETLAPASPDALATRRPETGAAARSERPDGSDAAGALEGRIVMDVQHLNLFYGQSKQALYDISIEFPEKKVTALIGPSGCGKSTLLRCLNRMNDIIDGVRIEGKVLFDGEDIFAPKVDVTELRKRFGMVFQKSNPFPKSIYENVVYGLRIQGVRDKATLDEACERSLRGGGALGRGQGPPRGERAVALGRPDAAALHRPRDRGQARGRPHGRALLGARPDRDLQGRGADLRPQEGVHDHHRDPQHAAGGAGLRVHGLLHAGPPRGVRPHGEDLHQPGPEDHRGLHHRPLRLDAADRDSERGRMKTLVQKSKDGTAARGEAHTGSMKRIALIEDDADIAYTIRLNLRKEKKYQVEHYVSGIAALAAVQEKPFDLVILDLNLPDIDGLALCRELRRADETRKVPIIMLTARVEERDKLLGFEIGADDYITKPFSMRELLARVHAHLRRVAAFETSEEEVFRDGELVVDRARFEASLGGKRVHLTKKEFDLLWLLIRNRNRVVTRDAILARLWDYDAEVETRTVDVHIRALRRKLGDQRIETVVGLGYRYREGANP